MYPLLRFLLFRLDPETSHRLTLRLLRLRYALPRASALVRARIARRVPRVPLRIMGLELANPIGLAAGLDKNAECVAPFGDLGFGFIELGTVTPRPQAGNPRPRLFRLKSEHALINRLGFNNVGVETFVENLRRWNRLVPVGINIGKNKDTPNDRALDDYALALRAVYPHADYITVNVSSPNTPELRDLQEGAPLESLLAGLQLERSALTARYGRRVPIALKIAPDLDGAGIARIAQLLVLHNFDAAIATNTTVARPGLAHEPLALEAGGLSGRPLKALSNDIVRQLYRHLQGRIPIIGVGGIENADDAWERLTAGADAIQIYTAFIYQGPSVVRQIAEGLARKVADSGCTALAQALAKARV